MLKATDAPVKSGRFGVQPARCRSCPNGGLLNPLKFFAAQFFVTLAWLLTFGALAFTIVHEGQMLTVLQGWGMEDPFQIEMD